MLKLRFIHVGKGTPGNGWLPGDKGQKQSHVLVFVHAHLLQGYVLISPVIFSLSKDKLDTMATNTHIYVYDML